MPTTSRARRVLARIGAAALVTGSLGALGAGLAGATGPTLSSTTVGAFPSLLTTSGETLYVLSTEKGAKLHCTSSACLAAWHPLEVKSSVSKVTLGSGVKCKVGFAARSSTTKQVTCNTYPLYTYAGDTTTAKTNGEALAADSGRWYLVHAGASTASSTPFLPVLQVANIPGHKKILEAGSSSYSLYLLTAEKGGVIVCTGSCAGAWPPLLVSSSTKSIPLGAGVKGKIGFVTRGSHKQVTFNSYPVYTYGGDSGPGQSNGEGLEGDGGTWYLLNAGATTADATPAT